MSVFKVLRVDVQVVFLLNLSYTWVSVYRRYSVNQFIIQHSRLRQSLIGQLGLGFVLGVKTRLVIKVTQAVPAVIDRVISTTGYSPQIPSEG